MICLCPLLAYTAPPALALTAAVGQPYHGRLINGIPFPTQFRGYHLREEDRTYTTPEVVGTMLDAIEAVQEEYPNTCDVYLGDFTLNGGGPSSHHRSHQNGRDVDIGLYAKGNRPLENLTLMTEENLDVAKTWCLMENLLRSQRVQYIFLDRRLQKLLYDYASSHGTDTAYLDRLFGNARGAIIQHVPNHQDHMHVRFYTPWSTLAARLTGDDDQKRTVIEMAQQAYLPKKVNYYVNGNEHNLDALAQSFGVNRRDLCRWNQIHGGEVLTPGSCLVFYKRGFELEPVHLAQSLQPSFVEDTPVVRLASLRPNKSLSDAPVTVHNPAPSHEAKESAVSVSYTTRRGDTLARVARKNGVSLASLCQINGLRKDAALKPGQKIKLASLEPSVAARAAKGGSASEIKSKAASVTYQVSRGDTLSKIASKKGVDVSTLCSINGLKLNCSLKPGQTITLAKASAAVPSHSEPPTLKTAAVAKTSAPRQGTLKASNSETRDRDKGKSKAAAKAEPKVAKEQPKIAKAQAKAASPAKVQPKAEAVSKKAAPAQKPAKAEAPAKSKPQGKVAQNSKPNSTRKIN